ncbi:glycine cleavage T protein [Legionella birminghamensis]|uniref:Glycine cleavage T protein n=2 Tax=Legionella birminghamensis TaxID=28083 RepID=A0A378IAL7_9GAMM|nr:folate-binding protein YgfZ [Legionella birminghamensis]KTC75583.1 glycine cleavage T protein [Legionella birminghamensis]STX31906.1 glycine cleavage T protein [Legionella birminghamensis]
MKNIQIDNRIYSMIAQSEETQNVQLPPGFPALFDLSYLSVIEVTGNKSMEFLQGQLTCDISKINSETMRQAAFCNLKGRILALANIINWQNYQLILPQDLTEKTIESLNKPAMLSRVQLRAASDLSVFGLYAPPHSQALAHFGITLPTEQYAVVSSQMLCCFSLGNGFYQIISKDNDIRNYFDKTGHLFGSAAWHQLQLLQKRIEIYPSSRGLFLPHRVDLHLAGYLDFQKGCYKGQEIIARTHYKATLKHKLAVFFIETGEDLQLGQRVLREDKSTEVGEVIDYCPIGLNRYLVAISILFEHPETVYFENHAQAVKLSKAEYRIPEE